MSTDAYRTAGHLIRRAHQVHDAVFAQALAGLDITSPQLAALLAIGDFPGVEQTTLADIIAYDCSTIGGLIDRLEAKGFVARTVGARDRRTRQLSLTPIGQALLHEALPKAARVHDLVLEPLSPDEREVFITMLQRVVHVNGSRTHRIAEQDEEVA